VPSGIAPLHFEGFFDPASIARGGIGAEIHVDLHADRKRARFGQLDQHFHDVDVGHVALAE
jgi:hypothetical protein